MVVPNPSPLDFSFLGTQQRVETEQMLRDGGWSGLGLESDGRIRVKDALDQNPREFFWERGFLQGLARWGAAWGAGVCPTHWERQPCAQQARDTTSDGAVHHFGVPQPRSISESPVEGGRDMRDFSPHPFWEPRVVAAVGLSRGVCAQLQLPRSPGHQTVLGKVLKSFYLQRAFEGHQDPTLEL